MGVRGELFSTRVMLQNRTYFFNVKENRLGDIYLNIVESKNRDEGGFDRQSVILFAEDLQQFLQGFDESLKVLEKAVREKRHPKYDSQTGFRQDRHTQERGDNRGYDSAGHEEPSRFKKRGRPAESREQRPRHESRERKPRHEPREQSQRHESREHGPRYEPQEYNPQYDRKRKDAQRRKRVVVKKR